MVEYLAEIFQIAAMKAVVTTFISVGLLVLGGCLTAIALNVTYRFITK